MPSHSITTNTGNLTPLTTMVTRGKPSVFAALSQLRVTEEFDSDDGSAEERQLERKEKQKQKKKSHSKKKNSDSVQLKNLAFVSVSKPKKSKSKKNKTQSQSPTGLPVEETLITDVDDEDKKEVAEPKCSLEVMTKTTPQKTPLHNAIDKKPQSAPQQQTINQISKKQQKAKAASSPKQQTQPPQQPNVAPPLIGASPPVSTPQSSSETELGAVYTPTHITITRMDGQMKRTVAVTEMMDQLLCYTQQNSQLLMVQEQLGHANRSLQDQLQRSAEIINGLQNEVTMFRQMCLNLQAEVSLLRSNADAGINSQLQHRPPPGMS